MFMQVNDSNEVSSRDFAAKLEAAAAGGSSKLELRSAVKDADYDQLAATVNAVSGCPHHVSLPRGPVHPVHPAVIFCKAFGCEVSSGWLTEWPAIHHLSCSGAVLGNVSPEICYVVDAPFEACSHSSTEVFLI